MRLSRSQRAWTKSKRNTRHYLSIREIGLAISFVSVAGLTLRGGRAGGTFWPGAWLEDEVETGPPTPTLPPRIPSSAECCLEDCEFCDSQRRPMLRVTTVGPPGPGWWPTTFPPSSDVLCNRKKKSNVAIHRGHARENLWDALTC